MDTGKRHLNERDDGGFGTWTGNIFGIRLAEGANCMTGGGGYSPRRETVRVREIMRRHVVCAHPNDTLQTAASILRDEDVSELPICDGELLVGLVTMRDLAVRSVADGVDPATTPLDKFMNGAFFYCFEDQDCAVARRLMQENRVNRIPVTDSRKHLVGMVILADLSR